MSVFFVFLTGLSLLGLASIVFLFQTDDFAQARDVLNVQESKPGVLYFGLGVSLADYKYEGYARAKPEVASIGSSRALQFKSHFFDKPFYNLGGLVGDPNHAIALHKRLLIHTPPKIILYSIDFWSFCRSGPPAQFDINAANYHNGQTTVTRPFLVYKLISAGRLGLKDFYHGIMGEFRYGDQAMGWRGKQMDTGFDLSGSLYYSFSRMREITQNDIHLRFKTDLEKMLNGDAPFHHGCFVNEAMIHALIEFSRRLKKYDIKLVTFFPPVPNPILDGMLASGQFKYVNELRRRFKKIASLEEFEFHDFHDPRSVDTNECEFVDGYHGGETNYARILLAMASKGSVIGEVINQAFLDNLVGSFANQLVTDFGNVGQRRKDVFNNWPVCKLNE